MIVFVLWAIAAQDASTVAQMEAETVRLVNEYRESVGFRSLVLMDELSAIAREHSRRMAAGQTPLGHDRFPDRVRAARLVIGPVNRISENTARNRGYANPPQRAFDGWLTSPAHRKNFDGDFSVTGMGIVRSAAGEYFFTQIFVAPRPSRK